MAIKLGVLMDPIAAIKPQKDSTLAMLLAAQQRGWQLHYLRQEDLSLRDGHIQAALRRVEVRDDAQNWYTLGEAADTRLTELDVILMRKDPPLDMQYIHTTYLLELAEAAGVLVVNKPQTLRDANEKLFTAWFPQCCPATLVSRDLAQLRSFLGEHGDIIIKPLEGMGGVSIFRLKTGDPNISVALEMLTGNGRQYIMAQRFIPEISAGDKRILLVDGEPVPYALARIPASGETRGNLAAGGRGKGIALSERDRWICAQVGPTLKQKGLLFVGLDVIGDYLTEINVTSPTCIRELDAQYGLDIAGELMDCIEAKLNS
ncbi:glutathione synthetase [Candidatus Tenderia electrophaga]|jgi:glutathione synthase|uniref:Glutathione synthetase n=1 Tax=Candidatus Tenderia electrophaga TaxID=1748243 RepID=A0A0S2T9U7_9GAMM|nr:glutathione synthetase [Candidatus Tenderia electrophaga]